MAITTNHYDLIVLGSDVAGLVAAALVARRGKRVLVIPHGSVEGTYRLGGLVLPLRTAPVVYMGTPPVRRVFQELGLLQQVRRQHAVLDGLVHVALPEHRLDIEPCERNRDLEVGREWPDDPTIDALRHQQGWREAVTEVLDQLLAADNALVADGFWSRRFLARVASQLPGPRTDDLGPLAADHPLRGAMRAFEPWLVHLDPGQLGKAASLRLGALFGLGPEDLPRGEVRLRELLLQRIELHSGEVKPDLRVGELVQKRGRVIGVTLLGKKDRYGCEHMIVSLDPHRLQDGLIPAEWMPKPLASGLATVEPVARRFVMHLEIAEIGLSPAFAGMVACVPREPAAAGIGHTYVRMQPGSSEGTRWLSIERIVAPEERLAGLRERIVDELDVRGVLPFCRPHVKWMHSPHDGRDPTDGLGQPRTDLQRSSALQQPMDAIYKVRGEPLLGVGVLGHSSSVRALHLASRLTLPGLGLEGEFVAGTTAAGLVAPPARSPFARSPLLSKA